MTIGMPFPAVAQLAETCGGCGARVEAQDRFCRGCGQRLSAPPVAERRQLTVMFCDLADSTAIAARLDPEDVQALLGAFQRVANDFVIAHGGHVAQHLGDGLLAYFGYPAAHEDAPARAVAAGLAIAAAMPGLAAELARTLPGFAASLAVRVGIHAGPVVLGEVGRGASAEWLAAGGTVNIAARLAAVGQVGRVLVSDAVAKRVERAFRLQSVGPLRLKGIEAAMPGFEVVAALPAEVRSQGWRAPLVGRQAELAMLEAAWRGALAGQPATLLLSGEAGIGKSRLVAAFRQALAGTPHRWVSFHGAALHSATPLHPVLAAMAAQPDLPLPMAAGSPGPRTAAQRRDELEALADGYLALARDRPLVLLAEDVHWFDPTSLELLALLATRPSRGPLMLLCTSRPDAALPDLAALREIPLPPLPPGEMTVLVGTLLGGLAADAPDVEALAARSEGVPLFAEELARDRLDQAAQHDGPLTLPGSLSDLFVARLDRLGPAKAALQAGALIGRQFAPGLLADVLRRPVDAVVADLRLAMGHGILRAGGDDTYLFHHALLQDAAAGTMVRARRRDAHGRIADALAAAGDTPANVVAHHCAEAGRHGEAIDWYGRAGRQALDVAAHAEAEVALARAEALYRERPGAIDDAQAFELYSALNRVRQMTHGYAAAPTIEAAQAAQRLAAGTGDLAKLFREEERLMQAVLTQGDYAGVVLLVDRMNAIAQAGGSDRDMMLINCNAAVQVGFFTGELAAMEAGFARLEPLAAEIGLRQPPGNIVSAYGVGALGAVARGDLVLSARRIAACHAFAATTGHPYDRAMALHYETQARIAAQLPAEAEALALRLVAWAEEHGFGYLQMLAQAAAAWARGVRGIPGQAPPLQAIIDAFAAAGARIALTVQFNRLAEIERVAGDLAAARRAIDAALSCNPQERVYRPAGWRELARIEAASGDLDAALAAAAEAGALSGRLGLRSEHFADGVLEADLLLRAGRPAAARARLDALSCDEDIGFAADRLLADRLRARLG